MKKQYSKKQGFTLVEMLVAIVIFLILMGAVLGIFISSIKAQRYYLASQKLSDQVSYVMEYMSKTIRMAKRQESYISVPCITNDFNYENTGGGIDSEIKFLRVKDGSLVCQQFYVDAEKIKQDITGMGISDLTSDDLKINYLQFRISGEKKGCEIYNSVSSPDWTDISCQPRVTIYLDAEVKGMNPAPKIQIQTTVSQRDLDINTVP